MATPSLDQPPLTWRSHAWRLALCVLLSAMAWGQVAEGQLQEHRTLLWIDIVGGVASYVVIFWRRRWPVPVAVLTMGISAVSGLAAGPAILATVSVATRRRIGEVGLVGLAAIASGLVFNEAEPVSDNDPLWLVFTVNTVFVVAFIGWGMYIGSRRELLRTLTERAERAEAERDLRADSARAHERARIAREMHDVLAHRISQVSMHAGAMAFREDLSADELRAGASLIQARANQALTELRSVLGVLRDANGELLDKPQPTYADLPSLVDQARQTGMNIEYDDLVVGAVPDPAGRTVYRIVQEGLTNAHKHAPGAVVRVQLSGSCSDGLDILLRNPTGFAGTPAAPGAGLGLVGLAERAELGGGRLEHGRDGSTFVLHGWIPWAA